ncbi:MAG: HDIG domain-containing protein [Bacteroidales bacterium]|nr:HDIG domain-containing protein [Bacteroidales bacterium]
MQKYRDIILRIMAFVLTAVVVVVSFPNVEKFNYEYELQRPWRYQNVIAPFDFSIQKTESELTQERDSLRKYVRPIYRKDSISSGQINDEVKSRLESFEPRLSLYCPANINTDTLFSCMKRDLEAKLIEAYAQGIIELPDGVVVPSEYELSLVRGNIAEPYTLSEFLSLKDAYSEVSKQLTVDLMRRYGLGADWCRVLVQKLPIAELIIANVTYDKERTEMELEQRLQTVSLAQGKVFAGQRIIGTGDIVDKRSAKILDSLRLASEKMYGNSEVELPILLGESIMVVLLLASLFLFLFFYHKEVWGNIRSMSFVLLLVMIAVVIAGILSARHDNITFIIPYVIMPITLRLLMDSRIAMYVHTVTIIFVSFMAHNSQLFLMLHIPAGMIAIVSLVNLTRRWQLLKTAFMVFVYYALIYSGYVIWQTGDMVESLGGIPYVMLAVNCILILLSYPALYIVERLFGFVSEVTLMELSDTNNPLLRELSEKAPGTFQHSIQVANLAQDVAYAIGANAMLVRAGAMYHDIGKIISPMYFTENQAGGINPHSVLSYEESAKIVISHVENGIKLAKKAKLPQQIIDIIKTHHGNATARYFYIAYCNEHQGEDINLKAFSYVGPSPQTKEQAITMMADAVEASSKSLQMYTDDAIENLVEKIVSIQLEDKQLNESPLTFKDIELAKQVMKNKLKNIYHARIQYPELLR